MIWMGCCHEQCDDLDGVWVGQVIMDDHRVGQRDFLKKNGHRTCASFLFAPVWSIAPDEAHQETRCCIQELCFNNDVRTMSDT
jgi:hypothetical protein